MFEYEDRDDNQFSYSGGCSMVMYKRLKAIVCRVGSQELRKYSLFYTDVAGESVLDELVCTSGKTKLNPLSFSYGTGNGIEAFTTSNITTGRYYDLDDASDINSLRLIGGGRFDYERGTNGLIVYPSASPYFHNKSNGANWIINPFTSDKEILVYTSLNSGTTADHTVLSADEGFITMLCADLTGRREDQVIKVNNICSINKEKLTFTVYSRSLFGGLTQRYIRSYQPAETVYRDKENHPSVHPKFWYTGDLSCPEKS